MTIEELARHYDARIEVLDWEPFYKHSYELVLTPDASLWIMSANDCTRLLRILKLRGELGP